MEAAAPHHLARHLVELHTAADQSLALRDGRLRVLLPSGKDYGLDLLGRRLLGRRLLGRGTATFPAANAIKKSMFLSIAFARHGVDISYLEKTQTKNMRQLTCTDVGECRTSHGEAGVYFCLGREGGKGASSHQDSARNTEHRLTTCWFLKGKMNSRTRTIRPTVVHRQDLCALQIQRESYFKHMLYDTTSKWPSILLSAT